MTQNALLSTVKIKNRVLPNRLAVGAMECDDGDSEGNPSASTYARYQKYFEGGAGFISLEAITCQRKSMSSINQLSILPENAKALESFVKTLKAVNPDNVFVFQLTHSGEVSHPALSSPVRVTKEPLYGFEHARFIDEDEFAVIMDEWVEAAKIAHAVGADGVDLKFAGGYLGSQVLRPFNKHDWKYGGAWENRRRFAFDLTERVTQAVNDPDFLVGSKISVYEGFPGGQGSAGPDTALMDLSESIDLVKGLEERGMSFIIESAGAPWHTEPLSKPDKAVSFGAYEHFYFQKVLRDALKPETLVIGTGNSLFRDGTHTAFTAVAPEKNSLQFWGDKNIREGIVDIVSLGRQSLADPAVAKKLAENRAEEINWCIGCDNCTVFLREQTPGGCAVYDRTFTEKLKEIKARKKA